jgi:deoxyribodipyrimidine photolyase
MINPSRIKQLNDQPARKGRYVLYWMQASVRVKDNPVLLIAIRQADKLGLPVLVVFGLTTGYPEANLRHFTFLIEGLEDAERELEKLGIRLLILESRPDEAALRMAAEAAIVVTDRGYLAHQRRWRESVARKAPCTVWQVEGDVVLPVEEVSDKSEWAAATIRRKIHRIWDRFLRPGDLPYPPARIHWASASTMGSGPSDITHCAGVPQNKTVTRSKVIVSGSGKQKKSGCYLKSTAPYLETKSFSDT